MKINKSLLLTIAITLIVGLGLGALLFSGGKEEARLAESTEHEHEVDAVTGIWTCSMHPQVRQSEPGSCPFCGMDLIPANSEEAGSDDPQIMKMSNAAMQLANIQTTVVGESSTASTLVLNGKIKADDREVNVQTTHFAARIEKLYKNFEGEIVHKGDKIASLYSPELVTAQEELIEAKKMEKSNPMLLDAAHKKLHHWKLTMEQIHEIESSSKPMRNFDLLSDYDGVITKKMINTGDHLKEGGVLLEITNLSKVWAVFEVYEKDLGGLKTGQSISFTSSALPGQNFTGKIAFIEPKVSASKRVVEIRADINNRQGLLKPEMFIKGRISLASNGQSLTVPKSAVLWTGQRSVVYTKSQDESGHYFKLQEVTLGGTSGDNYQILDGLSAGDEVVTNGAFTLDSEAQLKGKISMMNQTKIVAHPEESAFAEAILPEPKDFKTNVSPAFQNQLKNLATAYVELKDKMVEGEAQGIKNSAQKVTTALSKTDMKLLKGEAHLHWMALLDPMTKSLTNIEAENNRDEQRLQFINLSKALINTLESFGTGMKNPLYVQFCPMANNNKGATWISTEEEIINPYFGDAMLNCGNVEEIILGQ